MAYSTIIKPQDYFNTKLYTGTGASSQAQTGVGFEPSFVWIKSRSSAEGHVLTDAVRGATKYLISNTSSAEVTNTDTVKSFDSDGYTIGPAGVTGGNGVTFASWNWKANGQGSSNTDGSINTTYTSVNTTSGFSISQYVAAGGTSTVGHGLGVAPEMMIIKKSSGTQSWVVYHKSLGAGGFMYLNAAETFAANTTIWNNTSPTNNVFTIGALNEVNDNGQTYIAYCFAEKQGYSKFGSYVGNGNADGTFVYTGFKPAFILLKTSTINGNDWHIFDSKRIGYNVSNYSLKPNSTATEVTSLNIDLLSNGFKLRGTQNDINGSGTYIFMAFAESPFVSNVGESLPTTAR